MPTPEALLAAIIFGAIGMAAVVAGKRVGDLRRVLLGLGLMVFPYFVSQTWLVMLVGGLLTAGLFLPRR